MSSDTPPGFVRPEDFIERSLPSMAALTHCYGALVTLDADNRVTSKGSMVLVRVGSEHFIFTARHVADHIREHSGFIFIRPPVSEEDAARGHFTGVVRFGVSASDIAWVAGEMDVAAFHAPAGFVSLNYLRWFDAAGSAAAARNVRGLCCGEHPLATVIMGCPNYGHFRDEGERLETLSFLPMLTYISTMEREPWDGVSRVAQIHLELDDGSARAQPPQDGIRERIWNSLHDASGAEQVRLGGYSGGPLIVLGTDGQFLIGIVTEGDYVFGIPRICAVSWDDIFTAFERR